ncbi:MAG: MFS transporter [Acidobacteriota bacterium]
MSKQGAEIIECEKGGEDCRWEGCREKGLSMTQKARFPMTFWSANTVELFERAAYYAVASFVVVYLHETFNMAPTKATFLNGTILWGLLYFLPILSGTLADKYGFKKSLGISFSLLVLGYLVMGTVQNFWPWVMRAGDSPYGSLDYTIPIVVGILLIGIGGSFVKPIISGTVQKTSGTHTVLGFGIFYMTINVGSMIGRLVSYTVRVNLGIPAIFSYVATSFAFLGFLAILFLYKEPQYQQQVQETRSARPRTLGQAIVGMFVVLSNLKFVFFLVVIGFFWFIYVQIYNLIPLFLRFVDPDAAVELYTLVNPMMIVCFQLLITRLSKEWTALTSIMFGIGVTVVGMLLNVLPHVMGLEITQRVTLLGLGLPIAGICILISIASMALGEMFASPRIYQYIGAIAPKGQEGLYLGYANLPLAIGTIIGAPVGGILFTQFIDRPFKAGMPIHAPVMWVIVAAMGVFSLLGIYLYDKLLMKKDS